VRAVRYEPLADHAGLAPIFARALSLDPTARYADADEMRRALEEHAAHAGLRLGPDALAVRVRELPGVTATHAPDAMARTETAPVAAPRESPADPVSEPGPLRLAGSTRALPAPRARSGRAVIVAALVGASALGGGALYLRAHPAGAHAAPPIVTAPVPPAPAPMVVPPVAPIGPTPTPAPIAAHAPIAHVEARPRTAYLTVSSDPWAYVSIDGKRRGTTPLNDVEDSAGAHDIQLENPPLGAVKVLKVRVRPGEHRTLIEKLSREEP
jgi:hypothetical protein